MSRCRTAPHDRPPHHDDGDRQPQDEERLSPSSDADSRWDNDIEQVDRNKEQHKSDPNSHKEEDDEGYDTDGTSSYDSDTYPEDVFLEIRHDGASPHQPLEVRGLYDNDGSSNGQKRRRLNNGLASGVPQPGKIPGSSKRLFHSKNVRHVPASKYSASPFLTSDSGARFHKSFEQDPEAIEELCNLTQHIYEPASSEGSSSSSGSPRLSPLLETHLKAVQGAQEAQELLEQALSQEDREGVKPLPRAPVARAVHRQPSSPMMPSISSPASIITFRKALEPTNTPRVVTLSIAPYIVVHCNGAFRSVTGYCSAEILGRPLKYCLSKEHQEKFSSSITAMHDRMASVMCKYQDRCKCTVKVHLVGPEPELYSKDDAPQEKDGEAVDTGSSSQEDDTHVYVTHYGIDLDPVDAGESRDENIGVVSPDSSACGILG